MVNGPPTPPATTAAEIQDEARSNVDSSAAHSSQNIPQNRPEQYQSVLLLIGKAISARDFVRLTSIAEEADIHVYGGSLWTSVQFLICIV
jgi:COP9 signalosome complex subunit 8